MAADPPRSQGLRRVGRFLADRRGTLTDLAILSIVYVYLAQFFPASVVLSDTTITGGDTSSHFGIAALFKRHFLSEGDLVRWSPGNYGGFPSFIFYFPLVFVFMAVTSLAIPFTISFKLYSLLGVFLLPLCSYGFLRLLRLRSPGPALGATGSVLFLFNESNSMWGGNVLSTLAGQFSFGFSFALTFVFLGALFREMRRLQSRPAPPTLAFADVGRILLLILCVFLIGSSHIFTLMVCVLAATFFLFDPRRFGAKTFLLLWVFGVGILLFSGWFAQLLLNMPFTTGFTILWAFEAFEEYLPRRLWLPLAAFALLSLYACIPRRFSLQRMSSWERYAFAFVWYIIAVCGICFLAAEELNVPDIRFLPFVHFLVAVMGTGYLAIWIPRRLSPVFVPVLLCLGLLLWSDYFPTRAEEWVRWNYSGFESKAGWPVFRELNEHLEGELTDPRVAYEHTPENDGQFGTIRAFEDLPYFASRATLEGLHFQMSLLSPFVFYSQSLYSDRIACPFRDYPCTEMDFSRAHDHLQLLNVRELILTSAAAKDRAGEDNRFEFVRGVRESGYEIWKVAHDHRYVEPLGQDPEYVADSGFRMRFYRWYRSYQPGDRFLYTLPQANSWVSGVAGIPQRPRPEMDRVYEGSDCDVEEEVLEQQIRFRTQCPDRPHLVKVSYHPGWSATGATGPYLVSPAFLLVYPTGNEVTLEWRNAGPKTLGAGLNLLGVVLLLGTLWLAFPRLWAAERHRRALPGLGWLEGVWVRRLGHGLFVLALTLFAVRVGVLIAQPSYDEMYEAALQRFRDDEFRVAQREFEEVARRWPDELTIDKAYYFWAMSYLRGNQCLEANDVLNSLLERFPDSQFTAEAHYSLGICAERLRQYDEARIHYRYVVETLRHPGWSQHAQARLDALPPP